ncbi:tetratricopeptide repeat protein [Alcaligenaceae bacterium CGII-47]|nr:tetratricopeptide repeat protein [Alcaligenaceae bacterium CGII-47]
MSRINFSLLVLAIVASTGPLLPSVQAATALDHVSAPSQGGLAPIYDPKTQTFSNAPAPDRGWQALVQALEYVTPGVNTALPLSASQITNRISALLDAGQNQAALDTILTRQAQLDDPEQIGTDVQLMFLHARALNALERYDEASTIWRDMTITYPELPEPWNNLAVEYARRGQFDRAREALDMALVSDPNFAPALANLGHIQMKLAEISLEKARKLRAGEPIESVEPIEPVEPVVPADNAAQ